MVDSQVLAFTLAAAALTIAPGADTMLVIRNVLRGGRRDGMVTTFGICSGLFVHATLSALGVSMLLMHSATAFHLLKLAGACYLVWLGLQSLRRAVRMPPPHGSLEAWPPSVGGHHGNASWKAGCRMCSIRRLRCFIWRFCRSSSARQSPCSQSLCFWQASTTSRASCGLSHCRSCSITRDGSCSSLWSVAGWMACAEWYSWGLEHALHSNASSPQQQAPQSQGSHVGAPNPGMQATAYSVRSAPASRRA